jgi:tetratricopeptide (TPR) repeat protein
MRGLCHFKLQQFEQAEKDFQEAILMSDEKSKVLFYHSLGKCKVQLAIKDPIIVRLLLFSMKRQSSASKKY